MRGAGDSESLGTIVSAITKSCPAWDAIFFQELDASYVHEHEDMHELCDSVSPHQFFRSCFGDIN